MPQKLGAIEASSLWFLSSLIYSSRDPVAGPVHAREGAGPPPEPSEVRAVSSRCRDPWCAGSPRYRRPPPCEAPPGSPSSRYYGRHSRGRPPRASRLWRSEEHTSELQSLMRISYAVFCLKKKKKINTN